MREAAFGQGLGEQQGCSPSYWGYYFTFFSSCAQGLGSDCGVGISSSEAVCLDPRLLLFPEGSRGFVPSPCLPKALRRSKHPLGWDQAPSAKLLVIALVVFVDSCQILFHCSPPTGRAGGAQCRRHSGDAARTDPHSYCLGRALGCLPVSRVLDVMQGQLGLLSSFWKISCCAAATCRNCVGEAQLSCSSMGLLGSVLIREEAARSTAGL